MKPTVMRMADLMADAQVSETTIRRAWAKWSSGLDDGEFPPPLPRKRIGSKAYVTLRDDFDDWVKSWPEA